MGNEAHKPEESFCEEWIESKLRERLVIYKKRHPNFKVERVIETIKQWEPSHQRWSPYMSDKDIKSINRSYRFMRRMSSLA